MWLKTLNLLNFKNYDEGNLAFSPHVNVFCGENGSGKTNLLDAIHYLSLCKSYFNPIDSQQIKQGADWFMVQGAFDRSMTSEIVSCSLKRNQKKIFKKNKKEYTRLADHIGQFPLVMISPADVGIVLEGSEERRRFMDNVISQTDPQYLDRLIAYNKCLAQRNSLLKQAGRKGMVDDQLMEVLDMQLVEHGAFLFTQRKAFMARFEPEFARHYAFISDGAEHVRLGYRSQLHEAGFAALLKDATERDRLLERTSVGIHRDDLLFSIHEEMPLKKFGSQGQQKSFLIALKLAQYTYLYQSKGYKPLLLLDDVFDKLDDRRVRKLMEMVSAEDFGQLFITDTDEERIRRVFASINVELKVFEIQNGSVSVDDGVERL